MDLAINYPLKSDQAHNNEGTGKISIKLHISQQNLQKAVWTWVLLNLHKSYIHPCSVHIYAHEHPNLKQIIPTLYLPLFAIITKKKRHIVQSTLESREKNDNDVDSNQIRSINLHSLYLPCRFDWIKKIALGPHFVYSTSLLYLRDPWSFRA